MRSRIVLGVLSSVTNAQYAELLNAKAAADPLGLYSPNLGSDPQGGIARSGTIGSYTYAVKPGFANKPVNFVSFFDALRFTNWLNNGQGSGDTEDGAYTLLGGTATPSNGSTVRFNRGTVFLPSENEWYKAGTTIRRRRATSTSRPGPTPRRSARRRRERQTERTVSAPWGV